VKTATTGKGTALRQFFNGNPMLATALVMTVAVLPPFAVHAANPAAVTPPARAVISAGPVGLDRDGNPVAVRPAAGSRLTRQSGTASSAP
jgi:hypothetical protein